MVEHNAALDHVFGALAHPRRRAILHRLAERPATVTEVAEGFPVSLNAVSKDLKRLERAGLIQRVVIGRKHYLSLESGPLKDAADWLAHYRRFWAERLDRLDEFLETRRGREA